MFAAVTKLRRTRVTVKRRQLIASVIRPARFIFTALFIFSSFASLEQFETIFPNLAKFVSKFDSHPHAHQLHFNSD